MPQAECHDPQWLDQMYNNRARVPEHPAYFERWARDSKQVRERGGALGRGKGVAQIGVAVRPSAGGWCHGAIVDQPRSTHRLSGCCCCISLKKA